jgi:hypothetical protein
VSDSLDSLDKALDARRKTDPRLPDVDDSAEIPVETVLEASRHEPLELDSDELEDVVEMTQPFHRSPELEAALARTELAKNAPPRSITPEIPPPASIPPAPTTEKHLARTLPVSSSRAPAPPSGHHPQHAPRRPTSIAPVALDVPSHVSHRPPVDATQKLRAVHRTAPPASRGNNMFLAASLVAGSLAIVGVVAAFALTSAFGDGGSSSSSSGTASGSARKAEGKGVRVAIVDQPQTAPGKTEPSPAADDDEPAGVPISAIPSVSTHGGHAHGGHTAPPPAHTGHGSPKTHGGAAHASKPAAGGSPATPPAPAAAAAPEAPAAPPPPVEKPTTGAIIIASNPNVMTITVDGQYRRVSGGRVIVDCGFHKVRVGVSETQAINVPCGGATTL